MARGLLTLGAIIALAYAASSQDAASLAVAAGTAAALTAGLVLAMYNRGGHR